MRRFRSISIVFAAIVLFGVASPLAADPNESPPTTKESESSATTKPPKKVKPKFPEGGTNKVDTPDGPGGGVENSASDRQVPEGFDPPDGPLVEDPCTWYERIKDDSKEGSGVVANVDFGFRAARDFIPGTNRKMLGGTSRAYSASGSWWERTCPDEDNPEFDIVDLLPEGEPVTIEELILRSLGVLDPPDPVLGFDPDLSFGPHLVQMPSLFWVDPVYWDVERTDTQAVGRVVSTVDLVPTTSVWDPGDGNDPVECDGPGQRWKPGVDEDDFESAYPCSHTYRTVEGSPFAVTGTVNFDIQVTATVGGAPAPENLGPYEFLIRTTTSEIATTERQVVNR